MDTARLTDATVRRLPAPERGNRITYDPALPGFGCRVTTAGSRAFVLVYRTRAGSQRRYTIGGWPAWSVIGAREEAKRLKRLIDQGHDPLREIEAEREAPTVNDLIERFISEHVSRKRPHTQYDYRSVIERHIRPALGCVKVAEVAWGDIDKLHHKITKAGHAVQANRVVAVVSKTFALAIRWRMRADNPAKGIERNIEHKRKRYPTADEDARLTAALAKHTDRQAADIITLAQLTGCRVGEAMSARFADLDLIAGIWIKPGSTTKQKADHITPLSTAAQQLFAELRRQTNGPWVFPANSKPGHRVDIRKSWLAICKSAGITGLRVHDLRHGFASQVASGGGSLPLIGALLGHSNPATTHRYAHLYNDVQRAAVERVGAAIAGRRAKS